MPASQYRARQVKAKTHEVVAYNRNIDLAGKPLYLLIPGGLVALASLAVIIYIAYLTWYKGTMEGNTGLGLIALLAPFYIGGVFLFSYGYELYDIPRALRLTAIIVFVTAASVVILAVLFFVLGESKGDSNSSSSSSSSSSKSGGGSGKSVSSTSSKSSSSSSSSYGNNSGGGIFISGVGSTNTRTVTKEVVREVPVAPRSVDCPFCHRSYVPAELNYACPSCGAATPKELIEESEAPK